MMFERKLNGNQLKLIAVVSMLIDHVAYIFLESSSMYMGLRAFGRLAFPIYAFLLVEGFRHTRNFKKYALRMLICALISEIPYNYMVGRALLYPGMQNIFWTLFIGLLMMKCLNFAVIRYQGMAGRNLQLVILVLGCAAAWLLKTDYDFRGIMLIGIIYWFYGNITQQCLLGFVWMIQTVGGDTRLIAGLAAAFVLIWCYDGTRGKWNGKTFFYLFYPVHLIILDLLSIVF